MIYLIRISQLLNKLSIIIGHIIIEMHFLSSKIVGQLQITLKLILDSEHVKEGERRIVQLREQSCYQLALATFISRSLSYNQKLLAIIELEKLQYLRQQQTIWLLKQVYFKENDKIASKIRKIMSKEKNIQMIGEFLKVDINICGLTVYRQIQFLFSLLKSRETAQKVIRQYFAELCQYFKKSISLLQAGQQSFFHFTVNLAQFYAYVTKADENMIWQKVIQLWQYISKNYENGIQIDTQMLVISIKNNLNIINIGYQRGTFSCVLSNYFKQVSRNNLERIKFLLKTVELFCNSGPILDNVYIREEFIEAILQYSKNSSKNSILSVKLYGQAEVIQNNREFDEGNDYQVNKICGKIVESIFISYNQWLFNHYLQNLGNYSKKYWIIVSLFMFVEQQFIKYIKRQIPDFFHELESQLENNLKFLKAEGSNEQKIEYCISILSMLSKFKEQISIKRLPSLIITLLDASEDCTILMPFCDSFTQHIWKQLTFLQAQDLYAFLDLYLRSLNQNQWTVKIKSYESIINIALYLEQTFQFYSHSIPNEPLFNKSIYAHRRISLMLEQNSSSKVDHQFLQFFFEFTKILLSNQNISNVLDLSQHLKIPYLIHKIETLHLFSQTTAIIIAVYNFYSHSFHSFKDWLQKFHLLLKQDSEFCLNVYLKIMDLASSSRSSDYVPKYANMIINTIEKSIPRLGEGCKIHRENSKCWKQFISRYSLHNSQNKIMQIQRI